MTIARNVGDRWQRQNATGRKTSVTLCNFAVQYGVNFTFVIILYYFALYFCVVLPCCVIFVVTLYYVTLVWYFFVCYFVLRYVCRYIVLRCYILYYFALSYFVLCYFARSVRSVTQPHWLMSHLHSTVIKVASQIRQLLSLIDSLFNSTTECAVLHVPLRAVNCLSHSQCACPYLQQLSLPPSGQ